MIIIVAKRNEHHKGERDNIYSLTLMYLVLSLRSLESPGTF